MRRKKKDMKLKYIVLLGMAFIVLLFVIFSFTLKEDRNLNKFEWLVKDSVMAIERVVLYPFNYVVDKVSFENPKGTCLENLFVVFRIEDND